MRIGLAELQSETVVVLATERDNKWQILDRREHEGISCVRSLIASGLKLDADLAFEGEATTEQLSFLCPIPSPEKILCIGKNYADHAREMGGEQSELPIVFNKLSSCLVGDGDDIVLPAIASKVDYEAELVVVMGKSGRNIAQANAMQHVFGYCIGNDITSRDWQKGRPGGQWLLGKTFDTFGPLGPYLVTSDEVGNPHDLGIQLKLNGEVMQSGKTANMIFPIDYLIAHVSQFVTWQPGDLLFTGTPAGVGAGRTPEVFLKSGDCIEVAISGLGVLRNQVRC